MRKKILFIKLVILISFGIGTSDINAQVAYEFTNAASGTDIFVPTNFTASQGKHSVVLTTTGAADPELNTSALGLSVGTDGNIPAARRLLGITLKVSSGGPDYIRASHPDDTNNDGTRHITNLQITADGKWRTYVIDLGSQAAYRTDWGSLVAEGGSATAGTENDIKIAFRSYNSGNSTGDAFTTVGATVEIDRIEFVHNAWKGGISNLNWGNNGNWVFNTPGRNTTLYEDILLPTDVTINSNINVSLFINGNGGTGTNQKISTISIGAGVKLNNESLVNIRANHIYFGVGSSFAIRSGSNLSDVEAVTYKMEMPDANWHLITAPLVGATYDNTWVEANNIDSGTVNSDQRGVSTYNNTTGSWSYYNDNPGSTETFNNGVGYGIKTTASSIVSFTGTGLLGSADGSSAIAQGGGSGTNWNLIGSQFPSHLNVATFLTDNDAILPSDSKAIYVWNGTSYTSLTTGNLSVGQAFFMNNDSGAATAAFNIDAHSRDTGETAVFYKNANPKIDLELTVDKKTIKTFLTFSDDNTKGLNPGKDIKLFDGDTPSFTVYSHLLENNLGVNFERQALPNSDFEEMIVPIGIKAIQSKEITFTAEVSNLPAGLKVFLEDRENGTFTRLDEANSEYKIVTNTAIDGIGRFYLHTKSAALSSETEDLTLNSVRIFTRGNKNLEIAGLTNEPASVSLFNILGKEVMSANFSEPNTNETLVLPALETGVYVVQLRTTSGKLNKKIILE